MFLCSIDKYTEGLHPSEPNLTQCCHLSTLGRSINRRSDNFFFHADRGKVWIVLLLFHSTLHLRAEIIVRY